MGLILDPCANNVDGSYIKTLRDLGYTKVDYCEITMGKDFFEYDGKPFAIIGNPPYSIIDKWLAQSVKLDPYVISYLIGQGNLTAKRIEDMNKAGYSLTKCKMVKVYKWYGMSYLVHFEKRCGVHNCIEIDRKVYR